MFKIEFLDKNSIQQVEVYNNRVTDNWIQGLPARYEVPKENFTIFKFNVVLEDAHTSYRSNKKHSLDLLTSGKVLMLRTDKAKYTLDEYVILSEYNNKVAERVAEFADLTPVNITSLTTIQHDFGNGAEDAVQIPAGHELLVAEVQTVIEYVGTQLTQWPYDVDGNFLGNN